LEPEPTPVVQEPEPEPEPEPKSNLSAILGIILLLALAGGGAFFYIKVLKPGRAIRSAAVPSDASEFNLDDDFFEEDDELDELPAGDIDITAPDGQTEPYNYEDYEEKEDER
jgi:hypothetical protein